MLILLVHQLCHVKDDGSGTVKTGMDFGITGIYQPFFLNSVGVQPVCCLIKRLKWD